MTATKRVRPAISRDRYHRYTYEGVVYPGVTGVIGVYDKSKPLMIWASRCTAEAAIEQVDNLPGLIKTSGPKGVVDLLTARSSWKRDEAASIGSAIHDYADRHAKGLDLGEVDESVRVRVGHYVEWLSGSGWKVRLSEALVINPTLGYGGTLDLLAYDENGRTVLADVKSGKSVWEEVRMQLAAYGMAERIAPAGSEVAYPMPKVDRYVVLHVNENGVLPVEFDPPIDDDDRAAFMACLPLARWRKDRAGKVA